MIRLPDIPGLTSTPINAPEVSPRAAAAPAAGLGQIAEAISSVSDTFTQVAERTQRIENARILSEQRQRLAADYANLQTDLLKDPDPASRINRTRDFLGQARASIDSLDAPPAVLDQLRTNFEDWSTSAIIRQGEDSARLALRKAEATFKNEIDTATRYGDRSAFDTALRTAQDAGLILPEELPSFENDFNRSASAAALDQAINEEPDTILGAIENPEFVRNYPGITPEDLPRLRSAAIRSRENKRAEEFDILETAFLQGKLQPRDIEAASYLTDKDRVTLTKTLSESRPPSPTDHSAAWSVLFDLRQNYHDPSLSDEDYAAKWNEARTQVLSLLPPAYQGDLKQELSYRSPANRKPDTPDERPDAQARDFQTLATTTITRAFDQGLLGDIKDPRSETARRAWTRAMDARAEVIRFIRRNPEATWPEIREATSKALGTTLNDAEDAPIIPMVPPGVSFDTSLNSALGLPDDRAMASDALLPPKR